MKLLKLALLLGLCMAMIMPRVVWGGRRLDDDDDEDDDDAVFWKPPDASVNVCGPSSLGYQCYRQVCSNIAMHWSLGGPPPDNTDLCRYSGAVNSSDGATDHTAETIYFALATDVGGYVSMSFADTYGRMAAADAVIGWFDEDSGSASISPYYIKGYEKSDVVPDANVYLDHQGAFKDAKGGLVICFSRPVAAIGGAGVNIQFYLSGGMTGAKGLAMNFAASKKSGIHEHSSKCSAQVALVANVQEGAGLHQGQDSSDYTEAVDAHGIMMMAAWLVFLPFGIMISRHRWIVHSEKAPGRWFTVHMVVQCFGGLLFLIAFILPFTAFDDDDEGGETSLASAHSVIGITLFALTLTHMGGTLIRPSPTHHNRYIFNLAHWWVGRGLPILAAINIIIGVQVYHDSFDVSKGKWYFPVVVFIIAWVLAFVTLEMKRGKMSAAELHTSPTSGDQGPGLKLAQQLANRDGSIPEGRYGSLAERGSFETQRMATGPNSSSAYS